MTYREQWAKQYIITKTAKHICKIVCLWRKIVKYTVYALICMRYTISKMNNNKYRINLGFFFTRNRCLLFYYISLLKYIATEPC